MSNIITSLFIYKSYLFKSYLNGEITKDYIKTKYKKYENLIFEPNFNLNNTIILDIKAYGNRFYILTRDGLYKYYSNYTEKVKSINDAQVITIDPILQVLFIISNTRGLIGINLRNDSFIDDIYLDIFNNQDQTIPITSIVAHDGVIFLSILNSGVYRIDYKNKKSQFVYKTLHKLEINNPQDIYYDHKSNQLAIIDYDFGLLLVNIKNGDTSRYVLPENDVPNTIKLVISFDKSYYIIQARNGLYKFNIKNKVFSQITKDRVSNLTTYYNEIFFTQKGNLKVISI